MQIHRRKNFQTQGFHKKIDVTSSIYIGYLLELDDLVISEFAK